MKIIIPLVIYFIPMLILWYQSYLELKGKDVFMFSWTLVASFTPILNVVIAAFIVLNRFGDYIISRKKYKWYNCPNNHKEMIRHGYGGRCKKCGNYN